MNHTWTKDEIRERIEQNDKWLEHAICALYDRQTSYEKQVEDSNMHNSIGFNKPDSHKLSYYAKWIRSGERLSGHHLENARRKMLKYSGQLTKIANGEI